MKLKSFLFSSVLSLFMLSFFNPSSYAEPAMNSPKNNGPQTTVANLPPQGIYFYNRVTKQIEQEKVLGDFWINLAYKSAVGTWFTHRVLPKKWMSIKMGDFENSPKSLKKIPGFIHDYNIDMSLFEEKEYENFNQFFIRKFKEGARPFGQESNTLYAGAEARYLAVGKITSNTPFTVKNVKINLPELLGNKKLADQFEGGSLLIARLCPVDYHRFHFPFTGRSLDFYRIHGDYHSVNPIALAARPSILFENERTVSLLESPTLGKVAMIEVGALGVGKIIQSASSDSQEKIAEHFTVGQEKGYFLFGGSTVIFVIQNPQFKVDADILEHSHQGIETWVPLGQSLGEI